MKRYFAVLAGLALVVSLLARCGSDEEKAKDAAAVPMADVKGDAIKPGDAARLDGTVTDAGKRGDAVKPSDAAPGDTTLADTGKGGDMVQPSDAAPGDTTLADTGKGGDVVQPSDAAPGDTTLPDSAVSEDKIARADTGGLDLGEPDVSQPEMGTISVTGTLALQGNGIKPVDNSMYYVMLIAPGWDPSQGDPADKILAVLALFPGEGYTGGEFTIPQEGNTLLKWDPSAPNGNPIVPDPYLAKPGPYVLAAAFHPDKDKEDKPPTHIWYTELLIEKVPFEYNMTAVLKPIGPPPG